MIRFPNAKINLGLRVLRKRDDGYHDIESLLYPLALCDALEIVPSASSKSAFNYTGLPIPPGGKNLCEKAIDLLSEKYSLPAVKLHLHKNIPMEAGLGGGSSDAAFCLMMLNDLFKLNITDDEMMPYAAELGSDCAFFIRNKACLATGRGDELSDFNLDLKEYFIRIVKPPVSVSTEEAYRNLTVENKQAPLKNILSGTDPAQWKEKLNNDFEKYVFRRFPEIEIIKKKLYEEGALYASMSGSGSAVFGLFEKKLLFSTDYRNCFVWDGKLT